MMTEDTWELRRHCPECGRFISDVVAEYSYSTGYWVGPYLAKVTAICKTHGTVDMGHAPWMWEDFDLDERVIA